MAHTSFTAQMAAATGLNEQYIIPYGLDKAKVSLKALKSSDKRGKLILVSALTPTPPARARPPSPSVWLRG